MTTPASFEQKLATATDQHRPELAAGWILQEFHQFYDAFGRIPDRAKTAFEQQAATTSLALSRKRLSIYSASIAALAKRLETAYPSLCTQDRAWNLVEANYLKQIENRYEADLAFAFLQSLRRMVFSGEWHPVEYTFSDAIYNDANSKHTIWRCFHTQAQFDVPIVKAMLKIPNFNTGYINLDGDAKQVAAKLNADYQLSNSAAQSLATVEMIEAGFYRNRGAYLVGRVRFREGGLKPLIIALINSTAGIYVDAVLTTEADAHNIFSSTLANFHVTTTYYHELAKFLHSVMPKRPLGLHYSTIGFNHLGKVAVMNELRRELETNGEVFATAIGSLGTVAIGFSSPHSAYNLKVIRDHPTTGYKWGKFDGIASVLRKYSRVHEINRTGSMLDNIIYYNLSLDRSWFDRDLLQELAEAAAKSVQIHGDSVFLRHLIVQRRVTPLPVFLKTATLEQAQQAIINLGYCIKNNAAANIFNKDLDARNYGVSRFLKVYLFDYDALEPFIEVKIRSNQAYDYGEEDVPDWYFEDGVVFLPEEIESGLRIPNRHLRNIFLNTHGDLLKTYYWESIQNALLQNEVPAIRIYPEQHQLEPIDRRFQIKTA